MAMGVFSTLDGPDRRLGHFPLVNGKHPADWMAESLFPSHDLGIEFDGIGQSWKHIQIQSAMEARSTSRSGRAASRLGLRGRVDPCQKVCLGDRLPQEHARFHARTPPAVTCCASVGRLVANPLPRLARSARRIHPP